MIQSINMSQYLNRTSTTKIELPTSNRNYTIFDKAKVDSFVEKKEQSLPQLKEILTNSKDEKEIVEALYITDRLIDAGTKGIPAMYPILSKYNNTKSPNIQSFLAGIYRKTQVPDAFGPLVKMLIQNSTEKKTVGVETPTYKSLPFDPNEEIGGAILEYISTYSKGKPKIDYTA